jgi:hypothetical protein
MPLVCTEAGYWNADVIGADDKRCIEVEVKKSRADFLNDFRSKVFKHKTYANLAPDGISIWSPAFFYYFVPQELGSGCLATLDEMGIKHAGLATLDMSSLKAYSAGKHVTVLRRAPRLHNKKPHPKLVRSIQMRMGSELTTLRLVLENLKKATPEQAAIVIAEAVQLSKLLVDAKDWESDEAPPAG